MDKIVDISSGIDRASPEPFYLQLSRQIEAAIDRGDYAPGERIPTESELCRTYDLARSTVRETLRTLEDRKRIRVVPRRGAFVIEAAEPGWVLQVADGFFEGEVDHNQRNVATQVLEAKITAFSGAPARALKMKDGDQGYYLRRLRQLDGKMALLSVNYLVPELQKVVEASDVMTGSGSLNRTLKAHGLRTYSARRTVESVAAPADIAELLQVAPGAPLLLVTSIAWDKEMRPFDYYTAWVRSDVVKVMVEASAMPVSR